MNLDTKISDIKFICEWDIGKLKKGQEYSFEMLLNLYSDLDDDYTYLKEKYDNLVQDVEDNYEPIPMSNQVGIDDRDFM